MISALVRPTRLAPFLFALIFGTLATLSAPTSATSQPADPSGTWVSLGPFELPQLGPGAVIYDPVRDRLIAIADHVPTDAIWTMSLSGGPTWVRIPTIGDPPPRRYAPVVIYDPIRDRMIITSGTDANFNYLTDTWALPLAGPPAWQRLSVDGPPPCPTDPGHCGIYDPVRDQLVLFRGRSDDCWDLWTLPLSGTSQWTQVFPAGSAPGPNTQSVDDPVADQMLVSDGSRSVVYALNLSGLPIWSALSLPSPAPSTREGFTFTFDPVRHRVMEFGGQADGIGYAADTWMLGLSGAPAWAFQSLPTSPPGRADHSTVYDPVRDRMIVVGGFNPNLTPSPLLNDTWALSMDGSSGWSQIQTLPENRQGASVVYDPIGDRMVVFGGSDGAVHNDTWMLPGAGPAWAAQSLVTGGEPPPARFDAATAYDPLRHRMLVFGGQGAGFKFNDIWALSLDGAPTWTEIAAAGSPPSTRTSASAIYDPAGDRLIVFGGTHQSAGLNETWSLSLSDPPTWTQLAPIGTAPSARFGQNAIYDPLRARMLMFGGFDHAARNDVWSLSLSAPQAWLQIGPGGTLPVERYSSAAIYDSDRDRMVIAGGFTSTNDTWALDLSGPPTWEQLSPTGTLPSWREDHAAVYDASRGRMLIYGGSLSSTAGFISKEIWELTWQPQSTTGVGPPAPVGFALAGVRPNPARVGRLSVSFSLPDKSAARLELVDIAGRRIWSREVGSLGAGAHLVAIENAGRPVPGVYVVRLTRGTKTLTAKAALLE